MGTSTGRDVLRVQAQRGIADDDVRYARDKVAAAMRFAAKPVLHARVRLSRLGDPAVARPALVQANFDVDGRLVRAQAARASMHEAVDEVHDRLRDQLQRAAGNWEAIRGGRPQAGPHEWRHGSIPTQRPPHFPREPETRHVVRHKAFSPRRMTLDEAAFEVTGWPFVFFRDAGTGHACVLYHRYDGHYGLITLTA